MLIPKQQILIQTNVIFKVHLQLRGFTVFIDVERLEAGKFDNNLLNSIRQAKHFILVLTPSSLDRCIEDYEGKDWVHRVSILSLKRKGQKKN